MRISNGFTLIEVLVALAIISIALTAIIKSASQNIRNTLYIQNKTIASWVGTDVINNTRLGKLKLPEPPDHLEDETDMLGQKWSWEANLAPTPNAHIKEINVEVFEAASHAKLIHLTSYLYVNS